MRLLYTTGSRSRFTSSFSSELLSRSFSSSRFSSGLLSASHCESEMRRGLREIGRLVGSAECVKR